MAGFPTTVVVKIPRKAEQLESHLQNIRDKCTEVKIKTGTLYIFLLVQQLVASKEYFDHCFHGEFVQVFSPNRPE